MAIDGAEPALDPGQPPQPDHAPLPRLRLRPDARRQRRQGLQPAARLPRGAARSIDQREPSAEWSVELPETPDFRDHATYVTPPMTTPGAYLVVASARRDFAREGNQMVALNLIVGDLVLVTRPLDGGWEVTARSGWQRPAARRRRGLALPGRLAARPPRGGPEDAPGSTGWSDSPRSARAREQYFLLARWRDHVAVDTSYLYGYQDPELAARQRRVPLHRSQRLPAAPDHPLEGGGLPRRRRRGPLPDPAEDRVDGHA